MKKLLMLILLVVITSCASVEEPKDSQNPEKEVTPQKETIVKPAKAEIIVAYKNNDLEKMKTFSNEEIATQFFKLYNQKKFEKFIIFSNTQLKKALPPEKINDFFNNLYETCGEISNNGKSKKLGKSVFSNTVVCKKGKNFNFRFYLDEDNRLAGYWVTEPIQFPKITEQTTVADIAKAITSKDMVAGVVIGTYLNGEEKTYAFGYNSIKDKTPANENLIFEIGSITKTFTAAILLQLEAEGKLNVDDPVQKYLPENVKMPIFEGDDTQITFKHISSHTSGLPRMPSNFKKYEKDILNPYADYPIEAIYEFINDYKMIRKPGETYEYSNLGMGFLGNILVKIDGKESYEEMIQERIFKPLGMTSSTVELSKIDKEMVAKPHNSGKEVKNWDIPSMAGAGAIKSNAHDMLKYIKALVENTHPKIINKKVLTEIKLVNKDVYACFNWTKIHRTDGTKTYSHGGATGGYTAGIVFDKENKVGVIILTNDNEQTGGAVNKIIQILLKKYDN